MPQTPARPLLAILLPLLTAGAQAAAPLLTHDTNVLTTHECDWAAALQTSRTGGRSIDTLSTGLGCGLGLKTQAHLEMGQARLPNSGTAKFLRAQGKTELLARTASAPGLALVYVVAGAQNPGASFKYSGSGLLLSLTQPLGGDWLAHANLGASRTQAAPSDTSTTVWALALERPVGYGIDLSAEILGDDRSSAHPVAVGARWAATPTLSLNAALMTAQGTSRVNTATLGLKLKF